MELSYNLMNLTLLGAEDPSFITALLDKVWVVLSVAVGVGLVIFIHELGHFLAAKLFGVKVEKFYVGFDVPITIFGLRLPRHLGRFRWGETEYGIGLIPLGGYVKMLGQDDDPRRAAEERERILLANKESGVESDEATPALDPRSYPAKSVWQRMIIISAGVVMNLLTSILFGAIAFGFGVPFTPAYVGSTVVGYPAWEAGIQPGGRVNSVGKISNDPKLSFDGMLTQIMTTSYADPNQKVPLELQYPDGSRQYALQPRPSTADSRLRLVGIGSAPSNLLDTSSVALPFTVASNTLGAADEGAEVTGFDGNVIEPSASIGKSDSIELQRYLANNVSRDVRLKVQRSDQSTVELTLPPQPLKSLGIQFGFGRVGALVNNGPAKSAGVKVGDEIVSIDTDETVVDAFTLPAWFSEKKKAGDAVQMVVRRVETGEELAFSIECSSELPAGSPLSRESGLIEIAQWGLAYEPDGRIQAITEDSTEKSDASENRLASGDVLRRVILKLKQPKEELASLENVISETGKSLLFDKGWDIKPSTETNLVALYEVLQQLPEGTSAHLVGERGDAKMVIEMDSSLNASSRFWYERGIRFQPIRLMNVAANTSEAFSLGFQEAERKFYEILDFLKLLFTGKLSVRNVGGPAAIAYMAGSAASTGISTLLLFLTFLSVNLAILNFLPIPALDGGHMVFLIAEAVRGKPVNEELQMKITMVGVLALLSLMAFVFFNDFLNLTGRG